MEKRGVGGFGDARTVRTEEARGGREEANRSEGNPWRIYLEHERTLHALGLPGSAHYRILRRQLRGALVMMGKLERKLKL